MGIAAIILIGSGLALLAAAGGCVFMMAAKVSEAGVSPDSTWRNYFWSPYDHLGLERSYCSISPRPRLHIWRNALLVAGIAALGLAFYLFDAEP